MVLYNVTVNVDKTVEKDWLAWMQKEHIPEVMAAKLFESYKIFRLLVNEDQGNTYAIQYFAKNVNKVLSFQANYGEALQVKVYRRYGDKVVDFRTMLEQIY
ncbi:DUF4286 family protein [Reichenbachiella versicolor]|uniref:DUF4286 family protein n=1 Tax=Reichenbachiella versicolor TaxID=1821036 RepID=UPI000D6E1A65|nr:DUF4286 family protein [Reichenbachiella versicolor]